MERLAIKQEGFVLYQAGLPHFPRNFSRDSILSAILARHPVMLRDQLCFCASRQGSRNNPYNGEEGGKIFHEYPGVEIRGLSTEFNACDTTALYLIGHHHYQRLTGDISLASKQEMNIKKATDYILAHLKDDLFIEDPCFCGAERFALKVTYWKDSEIMGREAGEPVYPVVYALAHIQNMSGLRSAAIILDSKELKKIAASMAAGLQKLYDQELGSFYIAIDKQGPIGGISSDALQALFYLEPGDLPNSQLEKIVGSAVVLETSIGYRTLDPLLAQKAPVGYHTRTVWPFEQALIHGGARKFALSRLSEVSSRIRPVLDSDPEIFLIQDTCPPKLFLRRRKGIKKSGCDPQLWTIAAKQYFQTA